MVPYTREVRSGPCLTSPTCQWATSPEQLHAFAFAGTPDASWAMASRRRSVGESWGHVVVVNSCQSYGPICEVACIYIFHNIPFIYYCCEILLGVLVLAFFFNKPCFSKNHHLRYYGLFEGIQSN